MALLIFRQYTVGGMIEPQCSEKTLKSFHKVMWVYHIYTKEYYTAIYKNKIINVCNSLQYEYNEYCYMNTFNMTFMLNEVIQKKKH